MGALTVIRLPQLAGSLSSIRNALRGLSSSTWFKSLAGGAATFFSFEWLTDGGLVDSVSGTLGVTETTGTIIIVVVIGLGIYLAFRYLDSKIPARPRSSNGGGNRGNGGNHNNRNRGNNTRSNGGS